METSMSQPHNGRIAIYYEHPEWFLPLFAELDRRGIAYDKLLATAHQFDPAQRQSLYALIVNRMSPSAFTRGHTHAIAYTQQYLAYLKRIGANVLNGYDSFIYETSKSLQLSLFEDLGLNYPRSRVINHASQAAQAAEGLQFPVVVKANIGGSGAGIYKFDTPEQLQQAAEADTIALGLDHIALVQEYLPARDKSIIRVEVLNGKYLYAIRVHLKSTDDFNLCPADYCLTPEEEAQSGANAAPLIEGYTPPRAVIENVERIMAAAQIDVGGVEYLVNDRDGEIYYYDVNALSNFVADAPNMIGFDPFPKLVDYLIERAGLREAVTV